MEMWYRSTYIIWCEILLGSAGMEESLCLLSPFYLSFKRGKGVKG